MHVHLVRVKSVCLSLVIFALPASAQRKTEFVDGNEVVANEVLVKTRISANAPAFNQALHAHQIDNVQDVGVNGWRLLHSRGSSAEALLNALRANPAVELVEPNYVVHANVIPNDPYWQNLYGMRIISGPDAWDLSTGSTANVVAVIDTGFSYNHPDLVDNVWSAPTDFSVVVGGATLNCPAGTHGYNAILNTCNPLDDNGHGTHTSGTVAG